MTPIGKRKSVRIIMPYPNKKDDARSSFLLSEAILLFIDASVPEFVVKIASLDPFVDW